MATPRAIRMLALSSCSTAFTIGPSAVTYPAHAHRSSRAVMLGGLFGGEDPKSKKKGKDADNGLLPFDFPELPELPELPFEIPEAPKIDFLVTNWWTETFAPIIDAVPFYVKGEGLSLPIIGNLPLWFIFGYLGPCAADHSVPT